MNIYLKYSALKSLGFNLKLWRLTRLRSRNVYLFGDGMADGEKPVIRVVILSWDCLGLF
jgi:hypothetical protein